MRKMVIGVGAAALIFVGWSPAQAQSRPAPAATVANPADARLRALYDGFAAWDAKDSGFSRDAEGEPKPLGYLPQVTPASQLARQRHLQELRDQLSAIPLNQLSPPERVNAQVFHTVLDNALIDLRAQSWQMPLNSDTNFWTYLDHDQPFRTEGEYRNYIARMRDIPRFFAEQQANMRLGLARGFSVPRPALEGRDSSIAAFLDHAGAANQFYGPFKAMPSNLPAETQARLRADAVAAIDGSVVPAYRRLLEFYRGEYYPKSRASVSARDLPNGDAFYRGQVKIYTTTDLSPEEIHRIGLEQVALIHAAMEATMRESGWKGDFAGFLHFLRTDPQFYAKSPDELLGVSAYAAKRVDRVIGDYFALLPRHRFGIIPVPAAFAPFYTSGRGGLDACQMNTYDLPTRPLYNIPVLTLHECIPGHSFQAALSLEQKGIPAFRQGLYFSGYGEGWGLYCEWLGNEMGIYRTPYEKFGQLSYAMWRAARLVIDTGIHRYGWSRQQAIDYLSSHTALSNHEVTTEVDRYISWPGQALSYKLGELTIRKLRKEAEDSLGPRFDKRRFHDTFLAMGAVPLNVLEEQMRAWIKAEQARPATVAN